MQITSNRIMPTKGDNKSVIQRLRTYIHPVDNIWFNSLQPANEVQVAELKRQLKLDSLGLELPAIYTEFLRYAGEGAGGLFHDFLHAEMSISSLLSGNTKVYFNETDSLRPYCFNFLKDDIAIRYSINLCEKNQKIFMEDTYEISSNFENLLFQCAVHRYEKKYYQHALFFSASHKSFHDSEIGKKDIDLFDYVDQVIDQYYLQKAWFSDDFNYFAYSNEMSLIFNRSGMGFYGWICFNEMEDEQVIQKVLLSKIGANIQGEKYK